MTIDVIYWIENIIKIGPDLSKALELVKTLKSSYCRNKDKVNEVTKDIEKISEKIGYLKKIGDVLSDYIKYHTESRILYMETDKFVELINRYKTDLCDTNAVFHNVHWETIENAFKDITKIKIEYINLLLDRINYFDDKDVYQIKMLVNDINSDYDKSQTFLRSKDIKNLKRQVQDLSDKSLTIHNIFNSTINNIINGLKKV